ELVLARALQFVTPWVAYKRITGIHDKRQRHMQLKLSTSVLLDRERKSIVRSTGECSRPQIEISVGLGKGHRGYQQRLRTTCLNASVYGEAALCQGASRIEKRMRTSRLDQLAWQGRL